MRTGRPPITSPFGARRHLQVLVAVAEEGSMAAAARRLDTSQPAVTRLVKRFEAALGVTLFERSRQGCTPTFMGAVAVAHARHLLKKIDEAETQIRAIEALRQRLEKG